MPSNLVRRSYAPALSFNLILRFCKFCTGASRISIDKSQNADDSISVNDFLKPLSSYSPSFHLSPLFVSEGIPSGDYNVELVDPDTWKLSSGLTQASRVPEGALRRTSIVEDLDASASCRAQGGIELDFDEIEDMRVHGHLFYKLDRDSKEFEEYNMKFRGKKSSKNKNSIKEIKSKDSSSRNATGTEEFKKDKRKQLEPLEKGNSVKYFSARVEEVPEFVKEKYGVFDDEVEGHSMGKRLRTPTFNQLTAPYHEPFCLDIYVSKGSVRACVVHRVTSKVVAVAHSISKDMKFDLSSTKNKATCAAVGAVLAQRALADDIHDVVYSPRKGERLEGKLQVVLQAVIDGGVNVNVKIKQRRPKRNAHVASA